MGGGGNNNGYNQVDMITMEIITIIIRTIIIIKTTSRISITITTRITMMGQNSNVYNQGGGGAHGQQMQQGEQAQKQGQMQQEASIDSVNVQGVDQGMKLKPFDRCHESLRTKLGCKRIHITWAYQSANGKQHVIVLKHDTITNTNTESKRIIHVGAKKYDTKSNITN